MHRIFDLLYGHNGVTDIEVFQSREEPAHVASVTFSNMYRKLTNSIAETDIRNKAGERRWSLPLFGLPEQIVNLFDPRITEEMLIYRNMLLNSLNLKAGTRLHIRLGSGSDPSKWPSLFNGTIMEVPSDDYSVKVFAIGDGAELMNDMPIGSTLTYNGVPRTEITAFAGGGKDPRVTVAELFIVTSDSVVGDLVNTLSRGKYLHNNLYGIENFGRANYATPGVSIFNSVNTYGELDVNLYEANDLGENQTKALSNVLGWAWSNSDVMASISVEEGSPWKIIQVCKNISPDFIAQVMPFGLRSTLYFGRPWWDYFYDYDYDKFQQALDAERKGDVSINNLLVSAGLIQATGVPGLFGSGGATPHDAGGYKQGDYTLWTYMYRTSFFMKRKTFTQFRIISSSHNLLENNIVASTENMCNAAQVTELAEPIGSPRLDRGSSLKYFDINVFTENIKMRTEPSGVLIKGNNDARTFVNNLGQLPGIKSIDDGITNTFGGGLFNISSRANENAAVSTLVEGMKKMYDGSVLIKGDASIYPSNYICLSDYSSSMHGVFQVRSVTHTFNSDSGFTTTIVPDLAVSGTDTQSVSQWLAALRWSSGAALGYFTTPLLISAWRGLHGRLQSAKDINFTVKEEFKYLRRAGVLSPEEYSDLNRVYRQVIKDFEVVKNTSGYKEELLRRILNHQDTPVSFAQAYPKHKAVMNAIGKVANFDATVKAIYLQGSKTLKNSFVGGVLRKGATKAGQVGGALKGASPTGAEVAEKVAGKVGAVTEKTTTAVKNSAATLRTMAEEAAVATAESGLLTKITKVGYQATNIVRAVAGIILVNNISELIERKLGSRQAAIAFPLRLRGKEFSAGIEGHKGGVVGDPTDIITATLRSFVSPGDAFYDAQMSPSGGQAVGNYAKTAFASILFALGVDIKSQADRDTDEENSVITDLNNGFFKGVKQTGPFANTPTASPISSTVKYKQELRNELWSDRHTLEVMNLEKYVSPDVLSDYTEVKGGINPGELMAPNTSQYVVPNGAKQLTAPNISQYVIPDNTGRRAKIIFEAENIADRSKINYNLINDIELAAGAVGIDTVLVTSANRDHGYNTTTGNPSRHKKNQALDLGAFNGQSVGGFGTRGTPGEVNPKIKPLVDAFVAKLETMGYKRGESRNDRAALWYYNDKNRGGNHFNHVHVSRRD